MNQSDEESHLRECKTRRLSTRLRFKDDESCKSKLKISFSNHDIICRDEIFSNNKKNNDDEQNQQQQQLPFIRIETSSNEVDSNQTTDDECENHSSADDSFISSHQLHIPQASSLIRRGSVDNLIQRKYKCDYFLKDDQYSLIKEYFDTYSSDELIDRNLFESHLIKYTLSSDRKQKIDAKDSDIKNALDVIDSDSNYFIDFNEFLDFLTLFFACKQTLKKKIISVLNGHQYSHSQAGYLTLDEANTHFTFLASFYQAPQFTSSTNSNDSLLMKFDSELISYDQFAEFVYSNLENYLFVKQD